MKAELLPWYAESVADSHLPQPLFTPLGSPVYPKTHKMDDEMSKINNETMLASSNHAKVPTTDGQPKLPHKSDPEYQTMTPVQLPLEQAHCTLLPDRSAVWVYTATHTPLSSLSAAILMQADMLKANQLELHRLTIPSPDYGPSDPISGVFAAAHSTIGGVLMGLADYPIEITKMVKEDRPVGKGMAVDFALDSGKGISRIIVTGLKAPMEVTLGLSRGFHNVPKIYGDETIRKEEKVRGVKSGLVAGGKVNLSIE